MPTIDEIKQHIRTLRTTIKEQNRLGYTTKNSGYVVYLNHNLDAWLELLTDGQR